MALQLLLTWNPLHVSRPPARPFLSYQLCAYDDDDNSEAFLPYMVFFFDCEIPTVFMPFCRERIPVHCNSAIFEQLFCFGLDWTLINMALKSPGNYQGYIRMLGVSERVCNRDTPTAVCLDKTVCYLIIIHGDVR